MADGDWRLTVRFPAAPSQLRLRQIADAVNADSTGYPDGDRVTFYAATEAEARGLLRLGAEEDAVLVSLQQWDPEHEAWVLRAGDETESLVVARRRRVSPRVALVMIVGVLVAAVCFYFIPGSAGSPNAGPHHDLARAIDLTVVVAVVAVGYTVLRP